MAELDCPKQATCPGCPLGDRAYDLGLEHKGRELAKALLLYPDVEVALTPPRAAPSTLAYRLRAKLVVEKRALGLYQRGSHRVVDVGGCRVLSPALSAASEALRRALPLPIHGADLRETSEGVLLTFLTDHTETQSELLTAARELIEQGAVLSVALSVRPEGNERLIAGEPRVLAGPSAARHRLSEAGPYAYAAHGGFVQAHAGQASYVLSEIATGLAERLPSLAGAKVLELFAGNGTLALTLARAGAATTAVESYAPAIALAERAAREQGLTLHSVAADAARFLAENARRKERFDAIVVNPPRRGLARALRSALVQIDARVVAYVSCNPDTLARDLYHLRLLGLSAESAQALDMIPWSDAVEALVWLVPTAPPPPRVLFDHGLWQALDNPPWNEETSGVLWQAKSPEGAASLQQALGGAERELAILARGNLRKQGTITRRADGTVRPGVRYKKQRDVGRHSLVTVLTTDADETEALRDFASIGHPVLGDERYGDARSNQYLEHRHGLDRPFVHCAGVRLQSPDGGELNARSELPPDLAQALASLSSAD